MKPTYRIAEISVGESKWDSSHTFALNGTTFEVEAYGLDFNIGAGKKLMRRLMNQVDAFALTGFPPTLTMGDRTFTHRQYLEILRVPSSVPVCTGEQMGTISIIDGLLKAIENKKIEPRNGIFFPSGLLNLDAIKVLTPRYQNNLYYGDSYIVARMPIALKHFNNIRVLSRLALTVANLREMKSGTFVAGNWLGEASRKILKQQLENVENVFSRIGFLALWGQDLDIVRNKKVILPYSHPRIEALMREHQPKEIINLFPEKFLVSPYMNFSLMEAALRLKHKKTAPLSLREWEDLLNVKVEAQFTSRRYLMAEKRSTDLKVNDALRKVKKRLRGHEAPDFAFVVHALSVEDLTRTPGFGFLRNFSKKTLTHVERLAAKGPGFSYGRIENIISKASGKRVNGLIYAMTTTPKMMHEQGPEVVYDKIIRICHDAADQGAKLIGLGAYTKVIGDSGETINRLSPIPVTTGNSLSASATLWAVHDAVRKMGLLSLDPASGLVNGSATVIGATGSIGRVSAKLLSLAFSELNLVAPRMERLQELALEIKAMAPSCKIRVSTNANDFAETSDVLVTATSAFDQKIIDVQKLKPGAIVCDCSRPLDFSVEDALKRPDILIIESGEVILPGPYRITCDLGLPGNIVYACLGETAVLALEGRNEPFTLGRDLEWAKVKEIYKMSRKHGVDLASIRGHAGFIYDKEIKLVRDLALKARSKKTKIITNEASPQLND